MAKMSTNPNRTIWKFPLTVRRENWIDIPRVWRGLTVQEQDGELVMWALVDPKEPPIHTRVLVVGTGWERDFDGWDYLGTAQIGIFVWHVFVPSEDSI